MPKFGKFTVSKPKNWPKFISENPIWAKHQFCKQHCYQKSVQDDPIHSTSPHFRPFGSHTPNKIKAELPPPDVNNIINLPNCI